MAYRHVLLCCVRLLNDQGLANPVICLDDHLLDLGFLLRDMELYVRFILGHAGRQGFVHFFHGCVIKVVVFRGEYSDS